MKIENTPKQKSTLQTCAKIVLVAVLLLGAYMAGTKLGVQGAHLKIVTAWNEFFVDHDEDKPTVGPAADDPFADFGGTVHSRPLQDDPFGGVDDPFGADDPLADFGGTVHSGPFQHDPLVSDPFASDGLTTDQDPFGSK